MDDQGRVEAIVAAERNLAHRIIEEFMLVANETVAQYLEDHDAPSLYRVHEAPDPMKVAEFEDFISSLGLSLGAPADHVTPRHFQRLLRRLHEKPEERPVAFLMLRMMQQARYDPASLGHFGLATKTYTHFTSPIRRYPDLVVHRALRELRAGALSAERRQLWLEDLPEVARHTSEMERRAEGAEREIVQWKKVRFMADKVGDEFTDMSRVSRHSVCSSNSSSTSSRGWCISPAWRTTTTAISNASTRSAGKTPRRRTVWATWCEFNWSG